MPTHTYLTLTTPGTKKISVCARRVGSRERHSVIAVCANETDADKIVDALNALQGEMDKLDRPLQRVLDQLRDTLSREIATGKIQASRIRELENKARDTERQFESQLREKSNEIGRLRTDLQRAELARDAAQKTARETA